MIDLDIPTVKMSPKELKLLPKRFAISYCYSFVCLSGSDEHKPLEISSNMNALVSNSYSITMTFEEK